MKNLNIALIVLRKWVFMWRLALKGAKAIRQFLDFQTYSLARIAILAHAAENKYRHCDDRELEKSVLIACKRPKVRVYQHLKWMHWGLTLLLVFLISGFTMPLAFAQSADISITKLDAPDPVAAGQAIAYTITVNNEGPNSAVTSVMTDTLPAGTTFVSLTSPAGWSCLTPVVGSGGAVSCSIASMAVGSDIFTLTLMVDPSTPVGTVLSNTADVSSATPDPNPGAESATTPSTVTTLSDLSVTKVDTPDPVVAGSNLTYTITLSNSGPSNAASALLSDTLPVGTTFVSLSSPGGWSCITPAVGVSGAISCSAASLGVGSALFSLVVMVAPSVANGTVLSNTATASSATLDPNPGNQSGVAATTVVSPATISATKTVTGTFFPSGAITYTIVLSNSGGTAQADNPGDEFVDVLPATLMLISASATSGTSVANISNNTVRWNGTVGGNGSVTLTVQAQISATANTGQTISNQGTVFFDSDGNGSNESQSLTDDPAVAGTANATNFLLLSSAAAAIPALDKIALAALGFLLMSIGILCLREPRRKRNWR